MVQMRITVCQFGSYGLLLDAQLDRVRDERRAAWRQCTADAVTLAATMSPCPNPAPEIGQLTKQLESRIQRVWELRWGNNGRRCGGVCCCTGLRGQAGMGGHGCKTGGASVVGTLQWGPVGWSFPTSSKHECFGDAHVLRRSWGLCSKACLRGLIVDCC